MFRTTPPSAGEEQKEKLANHETVIKSHFQELQKLIANRAKSLRVLALSKQTEATTETFYQFILQLLVVMVSWHIISGGAGMGEFHSHPITYCGVKTTSILHRRRPNSLQL